VTELVYGTLTRSNRRIIKGLKKIRSVSPTADEKTVEKIIDFAYDYFFGGDITVENFSLDDLDIRHKNLGTLLMALQAYDVTFKEIKETFQMPKEAMLLERMTLILAGLLHELDPGMKPIDTLLPFLQDFLFGPEGNWKKTAKTIALEASLDTLKTLSNVKQLIERANSGELEFAGERRQREMSYFLFQQFIAVLFFFASIGFSYFAWQQGQVQFYQLGLAVASLTLYWAFKSACRARNVK
jgi:predicted unusual protein kinase regulating ubiquinone biosynthesis (AarF/ABC1/UbiB family)